MSAAGGAPWADEGGKTGVGANTVGGGGNSWKGATAG